MKTDDEAATMDLTLKEMLAIALYKHKPDCAGPTGEAWRGETAGGRELRDQNRTYAEGVFAELAKAGIEIRIKKPATVQATLDSWMTIPAKQAYRIGED